MKFHFGVNQVSVCALTVLFFESAAQAQLGPNGSPINSSHYAVDLYQGPVTNSTRVIGMGGAYDAIAEGSEGNFVNPAAAAIRMPWSYTHLDYDLGAGIALPSAFKRTDFFNSGSDRTNFATTNQYSFVFLDVEGAVQLGPWGLGTAIALQQYNLQRTALPATETSNQKFRAQFLVGLLHLARSFDDGQLLFGAGIRYTGLSILNQDTPTYDNQTLFTTQGVGLQFGWLWRPHDQAFRAGASVRSAVKTKAVTGSNIARDPNGNPVLFAGTADQMYLPDEVALPWEWALGMAVQLGSRPFNPRWTDPNVITAETRRTLKRNEIEREQREKELLSEIPNDDPSREKRRADIESAMDDERRKDQEQLHQATERARAILKTREKALNRWYCLIATSLKVSGPIRNAVGVESFLQRITDHSGDHVVASSHLGLESEVIPRWLKLRAGLYGEPTRFSNTLAAPRIHTTAGFESKLFGWSVFGIYDRDTQWRIQASIDTAQRYFAWSGSIGIWH